MRRVKQPETICWVVDLGRIPYEPACELQHQLVQARKSHTIPDVLLICEHPHVITLGRNGPRDHLQADEVLLEQMHVEFHSTDRGGDITYHGPGQVVGYPILDLTEHRRDIAWYVWQLEEVMIRTSAEFGIAAKRLKGRHGVWIETPDGEEKLGALGVHLSRWVTSHGFAYNVSTDLRYFDLIVPCGIAGKCGRPSSAMLSLPDEPRILKLRTWDTNSPGRSFASMISRKVRRTSRLETTIRA